MFFCNFWRFFEKSILPFLAHFTHIGTHFDVTRCLIGSKWGHMDLKSPIHDPFLAVSWPFSFLKNLSGGPCIRPVYDEQKPTEGARP